jgi:phosphatidyl-myo-inositol dimannoside synthase
VRLDRLTHRFRVEVRGVKILALVTDAFGGHGGIAQYNRNLLVVCCAMPEVDRVVTIPRLLCQPIGVLPDRLDYRSASAGSKFRFVLESHGAARERFDLLLCGHINLLPVAALLALKLKCPMALILHGIEAWRPHRSLLVRHLVGQVDVVWAVSRLTRDRFTAWSGFPSEACEIVPNAIDLDHYRPGPRNALLVRRYGLAGRKVIMTLCRLQAHERYKGVDEVLEVMPNLLFWDPTLTFLIAGDGDDRRRLERKAAALGLNGHVVFTGFVSEAEKVDHYRLADAFVMPGWGEGFGIVYLEAMACGVPVLASTLDGSREAVLDGRLGRLVDPRRPAELEAAILEVLNAPHGVPAGLAHFALRKFDARISAAARNMVVRAERTRIGNRCAYRQFP